MNLRLRITFASLLSVLIVSIGLLISAELISQSWFDRLESSTIRSNEVLWKKIVTSQQDSMEAGFSAITRDRKIRKLIKVNNIKGLQEEAAPSFRRLSASNVLTKEQITDLTGNVLFSMPVSSSGKSDKLLIPQVLSEGKVFRGIERDQGELMIEIAFPILQRGKIIGAGLFMRDLQSALDDFKLNSQSDISVFSADGVLEASTNTELLSALKISLPEIGSDYYQEVSSGEKHYGVSITPILAPDGQALAHLVDVQDHTTSIATTNSISNTSYIIIILILFGVASFFTWYIRRAFKPVEQAILTMEQISNGDLSMQITADSNDEVGRLLHAMGVMLSSLREMIARLLSMSEHLDRSSTDMRQQADESKAGVDRQLLETEQVATAMNEMSATVNEVAQNAASAAQSAADTNLHSQEGKEVVNGAISSIHALHEDIQNSADAIRKLQQDTTEIGSVLDVIRGIAEQTNLLALNAAIEAARAGEQGRGFAVVADEVRTLAGRTQQSTEDINNMIERLQQGANSTVESMQHSLDEVQKSVDTSVQTGKSLEKITTSVIQINDMNLQIASAAEEQSSVAEEINRNVVKINEVAEDSAQRVGKTAAASDELNRLTEELSELIGRFKI
jgi:methyl-accepting chemotaxis protein